MDKLENISEQIREEFDIRTAARDKALGHARTLIRFCSQAIRAVHRDDVETMFAQLEEAEKLANELRAATRPHPDLYYAGYTQDALKEFVEAKVTCAIIRDEPIATPADLEVESYTYLNGLAEVIGELRRRCLDILRHGYSPEAERLLTGMDDIYAILVTMDYPDAITNGLRRQTDIARSIIEKTRGDITFSIRGESLEKSISKLMSSIGDENKPNLPELSRFHEANPED